MQGCWEGSLIRRGPGVATVRVTEWFIVLSGPLKHHPALQFWNIHLWLQNSMWDHTPGPTSLPALSVMFGVRLSLKWNINMSLPQLAPGRPHRLWAEVAEVSELWALYSPRPSPSARTVCYAFPFEKRLVLFFIIHQWCWRMFILMHSPCRAFDGITER